MKILLIDTALDGHHIGYLNEIVRECNFQKTIVLPEKVDSLKNETIICYQPIDLQKKKFTAYVKWMKELYAIAEKEKPDIVHFLTGDNFYKFFGYGLNWFKKYKTILTIHWVRPGMLKHISLKSMGKKVDKVVVHSSYLLNELSEIGLSNGVHIEYPQFRRIETIAQKEAQSYWNIHSNKKTILALGNTRIDKGVDILIEALTSVSQPFELLIAGKPESFDQQYISEHTKSYSDSVHTALRYLTDKEIELAVAASDIVVLPYRMTFNGASGPLGEGVSMNKCIIGSNHGNLGYTINTHHLGYTFQAENIDDLAKTINKALSEDFNMDKKYYEYKKSLSPDLFRKSYYALYSEIMRD